MTNRTRLLAATAALLTLAGCQIKIPSNLIQVIQQGDGRTGTTTTQTPPPGLETDTGTKLAGKDADCVQVFAKYDLDRDKTWSVDELYQYGRQLPNPILGCENAEPVASATARKLVMSPDGKRPPCGPIHFDYTFRQFDQNRDGKLQVEEACGAMGALDGIGPTPPPPPPTQPPTDECYGSFKKYDTNADGLLDLEEYRNSPIPPELFFKESDRDGNGKLSPKEFCAQSQTQVVVPPLPPDAVKPCDPYFKERDRNADGKLAWEEFYRPDPNMPPAEAPAYKDKQAGLFKELDRNADGFVSAEEDCAAFTGQPTPTPTPTPPSPCVNDFKAFDRNQDGALSHEEYAEGKMGQVRWVKAPTDEELAKMKATFYAEAKRLDVNADAKITLEESLKACQ